MNRREEDKKENTNVVALQILIVLVFLTTGDVIGATAADTITPTRPLADDAKLITSDETYALGFFNPPGSSNRYLGLWYNHVTVPTILWVANRNDPVINSTAVLSLSSNGTLIIYDARSGVAVWSSGVPEKKLRNPVAQLLVTGNLVVRDEGDTDPAGYAWEGFDYPTDTLIPGMKLGLDRINNRSWNLTAWRSASDPSTGNYVGVMEPKGDPELVLYQGSQRIWRTGPWNGFQFSGVPDTITYSNILSFTFVNNASEISYSYHINQPGLYTRLLVNYTGQAQRAVWAQPSSLWSIFWYAPRDQCDKLGACGPYGVCDPNQSPVCNCMQGFTPKSQANWALRDNSQGCVRKTNTDCVNGTDGFNVVNGAKLPDTAQAVVNMGLNLPACRAACLRNCSCTGYAVANLSSGTGCVMWTGDLSDVRVYTDSGQDMYIRVAAVDVGQSFKWLNKFCGSVSDLSATLASQKIFPPIFPSSESKSKKSSPTAIIIGVTVPLVAFLLAFVGVFLWRRRKRKKAFRLSALSFRDNENDRGVAEDDLELPLFDFDTIIAATDNFSFANKLGEGGFGPVYKGKLGEDQEIAVKRLAKTSVQGLDEFKNEVMLIAKLQHRNLVRLLGSCIHGNERMLVYEYMPNKSLDILLFDKKKATILDWATRYKIILGIARGLLYLHQDSRFRIIHRDLKASNILLDEEMNPKISDFGMARIFGGDESQVNTMRVVGTYGYMSPEYAMDGIFSVKSDVYSFGVLVLEIISGKKNRGVYQSSLHLNLLGHTWSLYNEGNALQIVDESMDCIPANEILRCIKVGLLCVQELPEDRPLMSSVILMLGSANASLPNPKQPGFAAKRGASETESTSSKVASSGFDAITVTILEGR